MSARPIRFFHRGAIVSVSDVQPTRSVLDWLREDARCTGTKEGCNEGDCGACTVVVGELAPDDGSGMAAPGGLVLTPVNACLRFLPTLDGKALYTVEDLKAIARAARPAAGPPGGLVVDPSLHGEPCDAHPQPSPVAVAVLHPVQQAMVDCHGSQCGFCTPGFVMSLWAAYERHAPCGSRPTRRQLADDLSGNLCRCTGYRPILDAGERMFDLPAAPLDAAPAVAALQALRRETGEATFEYAAPPRPAPSAGAAAAPAARFHAPRTVEALAELRLSKPEARIVAGATDVALWVNKQFRDLGEVIHVGDCMPLRAVREDEADGSLTIGAAAPLDAAWRALVRRHPALEDVWLRFASLPIRNAGTMGGNVANGSPIGDSAPVLIALDAEIVLRRGERQRSLPLADFYLGYMKNRLEAGEFVEAIRVPAPPAGLQLRCHKISKRYDCDISAVCAGLAVALDEAGVVRHVRLAWGGMAATVQRAAGAEAALAGQHWDESALRAAQAALAADFTPLTDMRASADYRLQVAQNLLERFWLETRPADALPAEALSVWSVMTHAAA